MRIIFPHIPKCAGTSIKTQLGGHPHIVFDYHCHPTWVSQQDILAGQQKRSEILEQLRGKKQWVVFGHFAPNEYDSLDHDLVVILLREPRRRAVSQYFYFKQKLPDNQVTRRRHDEVGPIKDGNMSIESFLKLEHIRLFYSNYYLKNLALTDKLVVLPMEDLEGTFRTIHELTGISLNNGHWENKSDYTDTYTNLAPLFSEDADLYHYLIKRTRHRLGKA